MEMGKQSTTSKYISSESPRDAFMSRTTKHSGAIKTLQFNPFRAELLATAGAKGELFISDLNNVGNPFRMGNSVARADDFECLDWNKNVPHIMVTGSSGGFVTVWDVKTKKESLTLNNLGRKAVSAVAWDPNKHTRLITAIPHDTDPLILVWDLRNTNAPERILKGHDGGVLSVSWCQQDNDLLLSCGKDNRTICWNPQTGESYGDFPVVTNWTFQTRWNPQNPGILATASFDGKIAVQSIQSTNAESAQTAVGQTQAGDDEDFFNKAQSQPQGASFSLKKAPRWLERPCGASFAFGGKVVSFNTGGASGTHRHSKIRISAFAVDAEVGTSTETFENALKRNDLPSICESRINESTSTEDKADWRVIRTLSSANPRKDLIEYLGFSSNEDEAADGISKLEVNGDDKSESTTSQPSESVATKSNRLSAFFDNADGDSFLADLAATKGAKTNSPFQVYTGQESEADRRITHALLLGQFEKALDVCLQEGRLSDAFMIAICGGQKCIDKAQKSYFNKKEGGPNYLRLLASVVGKNLWDVVYNADLESWKEVMAILCTYASSEEFPDLCEALGDRLEEQMKANRDSSLRKDASFSYLAGSKLEKVVAIWIAELEENEKSGQQDLGSDSTFSVHARSLQSFIEKVTVFREVTKFQDNDRRATSGWKLAALYDKYTEYADIVASHGQLQIAERYLDLLPDSYPAAEVARNRIKQATRKATEPTARQPANAGRGTQRALPAVAGLQSQQSPAKTPATSQANPYAPSAPSQPQNPYAPSNGTHGASVYPAPGGYQRPQQFQQQPRQQPSMPPPPTYGAPYQNPSLGPPPRNLNASPSIPPPSKAQNMSNWNDIPDSFVKPPTSRKGTPSTAPPIINPAYGYQGAMASPPVSGPPLGAPPKSTPPLGPPPRGPAGQPPRMNSPSTNMPPSYQQSERPSSSAANVYAPQQPASQLGSIQQAQITRGPSPYNAPPSAPPPSNRYAPAPTAQSTAPPAQTEHPLNRQGPPPPNPYAQQQNYAPQHQSASTMSPPPGPPQRPSAPPTGPPQAPTQGSRPGTAQSQRGKTPVPPKYPPGDRTHIPANGRSVFEILNGDMQRVKAKAPSSFKAQVIDTEKRLNILFDHLNNEDLLKEDTISSMVGLAQALQARDYEQAQAIHVEVMTNKTEECGNWMVRAPRLQCDHQTNHNIQVGVKRLIGMSRATP